MNKDAEILDRYMKLKEKKMVLDREVSRLEGAISQLALQAEREFGSKIAGHLKREINNLQAEIARLVRKLEKEMDAWDSRWRGKLDKNSG